MFMTSAQKDAVKALIKTSYTLEDPNEVYDDITLTATVIYENQVVPQGRDSAPYNSNATYPLVTLKYQNTDEEIKDIENGITMKNTKLNINVFAEAVDQRPTNRYVNGQIVVEEMVNQLLTYLNSNYASLFSSGVYINQRIKGTKVMDLSTIATVKHVYRMKFTLNIFYEV